MALPIKETPVLFGKEAESFIDNMEKNKDKKLPEDVRNRMEKNYKEMLAEFIKAGEAAKIIDTLSEVKGDKNDGI